MMPRTARSLPEPKGAYEELRREQSWELEEETEAERTSQIDLAQMQGIAGVVLGTAGTCWVQHELKRQWLHLGVSSRGATR